MNEMTFWIILLCIIDFLAGYLFCWQRAKETRKEIWKLYENVVDNNFELRDKLEKAEIEKDNLKEEYFRKGFEAQREREINNG